MSIESPEPAKGRHFLWEVEETAGFESCWLQLNKLAMHAEGRAVGQLPEPYWLTYTLDTDEHAATTRLAVTSTTASTTHQLDLRRDGDSWSVNGTQRPDLAEARDCDLACSPLTNTMPIIRSGLHKHPGAQRFLMAFVEIPTLRVVPSHQTYTHLGSTDEGALVRYSAGSFASDLLIDADGTVLTYPTMARRVRPTSTLTDGARRRGPGSARPGAAEPR